jgi:hypothetical protein
MSRMRRTRSSVRCGTAPFDGRAWAWASVRSTPA